MDLFLTIFKGGEGGGVGTVIENNWPLSSEWYIKHRIRWGGDAIIIQPSRNNCTNGTKYPNIIIKISMRNHW